MSEDQEQEGQPARLTAGSVPNDDVLARPARREMLPVSFGQWQRLRDRVVRLGNPRSDAMRYASISYGVSIPCAIAFLAYALAEQREDWMLPVYGAVAVAAFVVGKLFDKFQRDEDGERVEDARDIADEMDTVEAAWLRGGGATRGA